MPGLRRLALHLTGDPHRGDDLVQQAIMKLFLKWRRAREARDVGAYAQKILVRVFLDEQRLRWATVQLQARPPDSPLPEQDLEERAVVQQALAQVPPRQR